MPTRRTLIAIAATSILAIAAIAVAWTYGWGLGGKPVANQPTAASALSTEIQVECANIRHEYTAWNRDMPRLVTAVTADNPRDMVRFELDRLKTGGDAMLKAVSGYPDHPSKVLASAVATYNADLGLLRLEFELSSDGTFTPSNKDTAVHSAGELQTAYKAFMQATCGEKV